MTNNSVSYDSLVKMRGDIRKLIDFTPDIAIVLGSGLGGYADEINAVKSISYDEIAGFPRAGVAGHDGRFVLGYAAGKKVIAMKGRIHYYEGHSPESVIAPVRLMRLLGAQTLLLTNASGGLNPDYKVGDIMAISDHIMLAPNVLVGAHDERFGERFVDVGCVYDRELLDKLDKASLKAGVQLKKGVYLQVSGPSYETPAEVKMMRAMGADAVGMSTAGEAVAARQAGMRIAGLSCITDVAAGMDGEKVTHAAVLKAAEERSVILKSVVNEFLHAI